MLFAFVGCGDEGIELTRPVSVPKNIEIVDGKLVWDNVKNADEYQVEVNDEIFTIIPSEMSGFVPLEQYTVRVRARNLWSTSEWTPYISFKTIQTPTNVIYFGGKFYWDEVEGAEYYVVKVDGEETKLPKTNSVDFYFSESGMKTAQIKAVGNQLEYFDSLYSGEIAVRIEPILWSKVKKERPLGDGSAYLPYQLANVENLKWLVEENNYNALQFRNKKIIQTNDIDCRYIQGYEPIGTLEQQFIGEYDGKGFAIRYLNVEADHAGIFAYVGINGKVLNLKSEYGKILGVARAGGIVANNYGTVMNCTNEGYVKASIAGGIVGENTDSRVILNSKNKGEIVGSDAGGIVGWNWSGLVNSCVNEGDVLATNLGGGIASMNAGSILNSENIGNVRGGTIGGIAGENIKTINASSNKGTVASQKYGGGLVGQNSGQILHSYSIGKIIYTVDVQSKFVGGLVGRMNDGSIMSSYTTTFIEDDLKDNVKVGSLVGYYRSGFLNYIISTQEEPSMLGNTEKYIGEIAILKTEELISDSIINKLNRMVDMSEIFVYDQKMWKVSDLNYLKLYWEK